MKHPITEAIIFDMDGVLIDSEPFWRAAEKKVFSRVGIQLTDEMCRSTMGMRLDAVVHHWYQQSPWSGPLKKDIETDILLNVSELILKNGKPMRGVMDLLLLLKSHKKGLASSSATQLIQTVLAKLSIRDHFNAVHSAEKEPFGKPHPGIFLATAQKLGVMPANCLVVEDSFLGLVAAKAAGMRCILIPCREEMDHPRNVIADAVFPSLEHLTSSTLKKFGVTSLPK